MSRHSMERIKNRNRQSDGIVEEDSARALMQMRDEDINHLRQHSIEYNVAASSQLMGENNPGKSLEAVEVENNQIQRKRKRNSHDSRESKKGHSSHDIHTPYAEKLAPLPQSQDAELNLPIDEELGELFWSEYCTNQNTNADTRVGTEVNNVPPSTLDQIPSDDEDIAGLLRDFQEGEVTTAPIGTLEESDEEHDELLRSPLPFASLRADRKDYAQVSDPGTPAAIDHISMATRVPRPEEDTFDIFTLPPLQFPELGSADCATLQPHSDPNAEGDEGTQSEIGQHTHAPDSSIDFEAFDNYCAAYGLGSANVFDDAPEQDPDHNLVVNSVEPNRNHRQSTVADSEDNSTPHKLKHKRKRKSTKSSRRGRTSTDNHARLHESLPHDDMYLFHDEQSDHVLPGLEDMQLSSQEYQTSVTDATTTMSRVTKSRRKNSSNEKVPRVTSPDTAVAEEEEFRTEGKFTGAEISKLEDFRDNYCMDNDITTWEFNDLIQAVVRERPKAKNLWKEIYEIVPYRKKVPVQRFCRRRFHNYDARGTWTEDEDKELMKAVQEKGKSWVAVGQIVGRHPEDVRDRWRNYLVNLETRNKEQWTDVEIRNLVLAVNDCMQIMKVARKSAKLVKFAGRDVPEDDSNEEATNDATLVNWQVVSDRMGGSRSRLQCSFKWGKLNEESRAQALVQKEDEPKKRSWRQIRAHKRVQEMRPGDVYDFLHAVSGCQAAQEGNIPWNSLGNEDFRNRWTAADRKAAWEMFKSSVIDAENFHYQEIVNHLLNNLLVNEGARLDERWDPAVHGYGQAPLPKTEIPKVRADNKVKLQRQREKRKAKRGPNTWRSKIKSEVYVPSTDDEGEDDDTQNENQDDRGSITRYSNGSRPSSDRSGLTNRRSDSGQVTESANTTVDGFEEDTSLTQVFQNNLATQLKRSLS